MAKIKNPIQFSRYFGIPDSELLLAGVLDPTLNVDAKLFIDPLLLKHSQHKEMQAADNTYREFFTEIIRLLRASKEDGDIAWRTAYRKLLFREIKGTCLGYGAASIRGSGVGPKLTTQITHTAKEIVDLGITDPDLFTSLPLLEEKIGPDLISDMTTNIIVKDLIEFNVRINKRFKIPTKLFNINGIVTSLPVNELEPKLTPVILVPKDILGELPVANDWEEVCDSAAKNAVLRERVNRLIGDVWKAKTRKDKKYIRNNALASYEAFSTLLETIHEIDPISYDFKGDPEGVLIWRGILENIATKYPLALELKSLNIDEAYNVVLKIIEHFKHLIEHRGLSKELWHKGKRRNEKSVQRILFAVADSYCKANNLDINPEVDTGTGEIDFKFSSGYSVRVLVEVKLSDNNKLVSGYEKQLEKYKDAEKTSRGIYLIMDIGRLGKKGERISKLKNERYKAGLPVSDVIYIDGTIKPSASKL